MPNAARRWGGPRRRAWQPPAPPPSTVPPPTAPPPHIRFHSGGMASINSTVRDISGYAERRGPIDAQIKAARAQRDAEGRRRAAELTRSSIPPPSFDVLLLADTGDNLNAIASLLPYYDIDPPTVRVIGPALWGSPHARAEPALSTACYASPAPAALPTS